MATLADIRTYISRDLRDTGNATFSVAEVDDLANQGIDALAAFYPREVAQSIGTVASGVFTYSVSAFNSVFRVDIHDSSGVYRDEIPRSTGDGRNSGWEVHASILYTPPMWKLTVGDTLTAFGYAGYTQLSASTQTSDLDASGLWAVRVFAQAQGFKRLLNDRAKYQQWQTEANNTDVGLVQLNNAYFSAQRDWASEQRRLRKLRRAG